MLLVLNILSVSRHPVYNVEIVTDPKEMPRFGQIVKIPGYQDVGLICILPEKYRHPHITDDPSELLAPYNGKCVQMIADEDLLLVCFDGKSTLNGISLGYQFKYKFKNNRLYSITSKGARCQDKKRWHLIIDYQCDNTVPKGKISIPTFWKRGNCTVHTVLRTPYLCEHMNFSKEYVMNIKCITRDLYSRGEMKNMY